MSLHVPYTPPLNQTESRLSVFNAFQTHVWNMCICSWVHSSAKLAPVSSVLPAMQTSFLECSMSDSEGVNFPSWLFFSTYDLTFLKMCIQRQIHGEILMILTISQAWSASQDMSMLIILRQHFKIKKISIQTSVWIHNPSEPITK